MFHFSTWWITLYLDNGFYTHITESYISIMVFWEKRHSLSLVLYSSCTGTEEQGQITLWHKVQAEKNQVDYNIHNPCWMYICCQILDQTSSLHQRSVVIGGSRVQSPGLNESQEGCLLEIVGLSHRTTLHTEAGTCTTLDVRRQPAALLPS